MDRGGDERRVALLDVEILLRRAVSAALALASAIPLYLELLMAHVLRSFGFGSWMLNVLPAGDSTVLVASTLNGPGVVRSVIMTWTITIAEAVAVVEAPGTTRTR